MAVEETIATASGAVAMIGLPAYIGWADRPFGSFALYAVVAGLALALADHYAVTHCRRESVQALAQNAIIRFLSVALVGRLVYFAAILAI
jgi:hypothetical protein